MSIRSNVDARALDQLVTFQRKAETQNQTGEMVPVWSNLVVDCCANVDALPVRLREPFVEGGARSVSHYTVWIRADVKQRFALSILDRMVWRGTVYDIGDIPDQQLRGRLVALIVIAGFNNG